MSMPNIPNINIDRNDAINILIASVGMEELALAHILNAEGEKIQFILGTLEGVEPLRNVTTEDILNINKSVLKTMKEIMRIEAFLLTKLESAVELTKLDPPTPPVEHFSVTYQGGTGTPYVVSGISAGTPYVVKTPQEVGLVLLPYEYFVNWEASDGSKYNPNDIIIINQNETLTAVIAAP